MADCDGTGGAAGADSGEALCARRVAALRRAFCFAVVALAVYSFSSNTADPDLWGHVLFGQRMLRLGGVERADPFSWTAPGHPWINHEVCAELALGAAHRLLGGSGVLLLKFLAGLATFALALRLGAEPLAWPQRAWAWLFAALAVVEIAFGFAARPQIFTALALAVELLLLRRIAGGRIRWAWWLPALFAAWVNTHGGVLAGWGLLVLAAGAMTLEYPWRARRAARPAKPPALSLRALSLLWVMVTLSTLALTLNPWGVELPRWLLRSVLWTRPEIEEWNPTPWGWDHAPFLALVAATAAAFLFSRQRRAAWEAAWLVALGFMAWRHVRHTPLFALAALALAPPQAADAFQRVRGELARLEALARRPAALRGLTAAALAAGVLTLAAALTLRKEHPCTMEVPVAEYPVAALDFIKARGLSGNLLVFFDWGEMALWELPNCRVSIDGRLDTCYPPPVIKANWDVYNGVPADPAALDLDRADLALLPRRLAGTYELARLPSWQLVYSDELAAVLARQPGRFPGLAAQGFLGVAETPAAPRPARVPFPRRPAPR